jgi:hypothetical protein
MTDHHGRPSTGRLDLSALDAGPETVRVEAVVRAVMTHAAMNAYRGEDALAHLRRARSRMAAVTVALAGLAAAAVFAFPINDGMWRATDPMSTWAYSSHVPSNGELLAAFHGYTP